MSEQSRSIITRAKEFFERAGRGRVAAGAATIALLGAGGGLAFWQTGGSTAPSGASERPPVATAEPAADWFEASCDSPVIPTDGTAYDEAARRVGVAEGESPTPAQSEVIESYVGQMLQAAGVEDPRELQAGEIQVCLTTPETGPQG